MPATDPRVDAYLASTPPPLRPLLTELRARVHAACPEVEETIRGRAPSFAYHGLLGGMASFRSHCTFTFWKERLLVAESPALAGVVRACGRLERLDELPPEAAFTAAIRRGVELNLAGARHEAPEAVLPPEFVRALAKAGARAKFDGFPRSQRQEYLAWILDAKRAETRRRRIEQAVAWIAEGKPRNWKYESS